MMSLRMWPRIVAATWVYRPDMTEECETTAMCNDVAQNISESILAALKEVDADGK